MARARNIKPGLFSNELLAELPAFDRLLFIGMWCLADREGRLEDRPKRIKMELFPCDAYDVNEGLDSLAKAGFINRYQVEGFSVVEIINFQKHQNPHGSEKDSTLPDQNGYLTVNERRKTVVVPGLQRKVHVKEPLSNVNPPLDNALIPDSPNPDSLIPEEDQHNSHNAGESDFGSEPALIEELDQVEETPPPVDPLLPSEMTLVWEPDQGHLAAYAKVSMVSLDAFTPDATGAFVCHYSASGRFESQAKWVQLLVAWVKRDLVSGAARSNVRPFPQPSAQSRRTGFADRDYTAGLIRREDGSYAI